MIRKIRNVIFLTILTFPCCLISAQTQEKVRLKLNVQDQQLIDVLKIIDRDNPVDFYFLEGEIPAKIISGSFDDSIDKVLLALFSGTALGFIEYRSYAIIIGDRQALNQSYNSDFYRLFEEGLLLTDLPGESTVDIYVAGDAKLVKSTGMVQISGIINDETSKEAILGASIYFENMAKGSITDVTGKFVIKVPIGHYDVTLQSFGYEKKRVRISVYNDADVGVIGLEKEALSLDEVVVESTSIDQNVSRVISGVESITPKSIQDLPSFLGEVDVIKSMTILPGVSTVGEGASGFNVRGGATDQNLILIDEAFVFNSSHALGFFGAFNADVIKSATLYKGTIPVYYDGRLASVLDIEMKDASFEKFSASGGIGTVSSRLTAEIPLIQGKTSLLVGGRLNYSDWMLKRINVPSIQNSSVSFYDFNARLTHKFGDKAKVSFSAYSSNDEVLFSNEFGYDYQTNFIQGALTNFIGDALTSTFSAVYSDYKSGLFEPSGAEAFRLNNEIGYFKFKEQLRYQLDAFDMTAGVSFIQYELLPGELAPSSEISIIEKRKLEKESAHELSTFAEGSWTSKNGMSISIGFRYAGFSNVGSQTSYVYENNDLPSVASLIDTLAIGSGDVIGSHKVFEPRFSAKYSITESSSIKFGYGRTSQFIHQISNTSSSAPIDVRQLSNEYIEPQRAHNFSLGFFKNFSNNEWETSIDTYYRSIDRLIEYRDFAQLLVNDHIETELLTGIGRSYGLEFSINKKVGRLNGRLAYTFSRTERKVENENREYEVSRGDWYPSNYDKPHNLTLTSKFELNRRHAFSLIFNYSSGRPTTAPVGNFNTQNVNNIPIYTLRNGIRIPDYHRLDLAYTLKPGFQKNKNFKTSWTLSIYNLYGRRNAFSVNYSQNPFGRLEATQFSLLGSAFPSITFNLEFK